ncbi:hypothetical protein AACH10_07350 [Ideonella sp. DXS22W]|uniref:Uncharacterized protein n=1 Tax=Pseudaquabacterium inlustre TaxID=2984192 RepID=A0ABU9CDT8_9BURK
MWSPRRERAVQSLWWGDSGLWQADGSDTATHWHGFDAWCAAHPGTSARLWLSGAWVTDVLVDAALPLPDDDALLAHVRPLLQHYHGDAAAAWPLAAWRAGGTQGVSALHGLALDPVRHSAAQHGVRLLAVQPWWARALALAVAAEPALARQAAAQLLLLEGPWLTQLQLCRGTLHGLQRRRLPDAAPDALVDWLAGLPGHAGAAIGSTDAADAHRRGLGHGQRGSAATWRTRLPAPGAPATPAAARLDGPHPPTAWWA